VVAVGGDGTLSQVLQGIATSNVSLALVPAGTGNDFARTLGIGTSSERAIQALAGGQRVAVDLGRWTCGERHGVFLNVAGCGFDAMVAERINTGFRRLHGQTAYLAAVLNTLAKFQPVGLTLEIDGQRLESVATLCAVANAQSYGGGLRIAPTALINDGLLDVILVERLSTFEFLRSFPQLIKGQHLTHPKVRHFRGKHIRIAHSHTPFLVDGELVPGGAVDITVMPRALSMVVPADFDARLSEDPH
jgi:diacylglycerol kinase (ATP)